MSLRQRAAITDPGRRRRRNEDAYVLEPPLFAVADGMGGAQAGEIASRIAASVLRDSAERFGEDSVVDAHPGGEPARLRGGGDRRGAVRDGDDDHRRARRGRHRAHRPRRRLARVPHPGRQAGAADRGPLAGRRARPQRAAVAGRGGRPSAAIGDHPRARHRPRRRRGHVHGRGPPRRRLHDLLGRPHLDGRRRGDPRDRRAEPGRASTRRHERSSTPRTGAAARTTSRSSPSRSATPRPGRPRRCPSSPSSRRTTRRRCRASSGCRPWTTRCC